MDQKNKKRRIFLLIILCLLLAGIAFLWYNHNKDSQKAGVVSTDSTATRDSVKMAADSSSHIDTAKSVTPGIAKEIKKDTGVATATTKIKKADKIVSKMKDSLSVANKASLPDVRDNNTAATDNTKTNIDANAKAAAVFVPKYGVIPRNTTESNITEFVNAFPDKNTLIKINFDGDPDAEMQGVKSQITKVLKKSGFTNVAGQSQVLNPVRMPTEIHYELHRDGSVVIWVPVAGAQ